jgi:hypothetical protein
MPSGPGQPIGKIVGIGTIRDLTNNKRFDSQQEVKFGADFTEVLMPDGDYGTAAWSFPNGFSGSVGFHDLSADLIALALGGTVTTGAGRTEKYDAFTIPVGLTFALTSGAVFVAPLVDGDVVLMDATNKPIRMKVVVGAPAASGEVQIVVVPGVSATLTFHVADVGLSGVAAYMITNTTGRTIALPPTGMPSAFNFYASLGLYYDETYLGRLAIDCKQAVWTGRFELGETRHAHEAFIRSIRFNNRYPGALTVYTSY